MLRSLVSYFFIVSLFLNPIYSFSQSSDAPINLSTPKESRSPSETFYLPEPIRIFSKFLLYASSKSDEEKLVLFDQAIQTIHDWMNKEQSPIEVDSLDDYVQKKYSNRESYANLEFEIQHLISGKALWSPNLFSNNKYLNLEIQKYHQKATEDVLQILFQRPEVKSYIDQEKQAGNFGQFNTILGLLTPLVARGELAGSKEKKVILNPALDKLSALDTSSKLAAINLFETIFNSMNLELRGIGNRIANDKSKFDAKVGNIKGTGRFIQLLLQQVFTNLTQDNAKDMISGSIDYIDQETDFDRFSLVLQYAVPQLLKLLQIISQMDGVDPKMKDLFKTLEANCKASPMALIEEILDSEKENLRRNGIEILSLSKPINAGTIAQVHFANVEFTNTKGLKEVKEVAVRFVKPGMESKINSGEMNIKEAAKVIDSDPELRAVNWPLFSPSVPGMAQNIRSDIDVKGASLRQKKGKLLYSHTLNLKIPEDYYIKLGQWKFLKKNSQKVQIDYLVPEIYFYSTPEKTGSRFMIMEKVKGLKLEKFSKNNQVVASEVARGIIHQWLKTGFIEPGFIHADMHLGNFLVDQVSSLEDSSGKIHIQVPILDFGMGGDIESKFRKDFISLTLATKFADARSIERILLDLGDSSKVDQARFHQDFISKFEKSNQSPNTQVKAQDWVVFAIEKGIVLPDNFVSLSRGAGFILTLSYNYGIARTFTGMMKDMAKSDYSAVIGLFRNGMVDYKLVGRGFKEKLCSLIFGK